MIFCLKKCEENPDFAIYSQNYFSCNDSLNWYICSISTAFDLIARKNRFCEWKLFSSFDNCFPKKNWAFQRVYKSLGKTPPSCMSTSSLSYLYCYKNLTDDAIKLSFLWLNFLPIPTFGETFRHIKFCNSVNHHILFSENCQNRPNFSIRVHTRNSPKLFY